MARRLLQAPRALRDSLTRAPVYGWSTFQARSTHLTGQFRSHSTVVGGVFETPMDAPFQAPSPLVDTRSRAPTPAVDNHSRVPTKAVDKHTPAPTTVVDKHTPAPTTAEDRYPYWAKIPLWTDITPDEFTNYRFQLNNTVSTIKQLERFLLAVLPDTLPMSKNPLLQHIRTREDFIQDTKAGLGIAPMAIRLTPQILSRVDWEDPLDDPIRLQFIPLKSGIRPDHQALTLDSLEEESDSPVPGLVHRYPGRALFLATSICPVYCRFCTRSWAVGAHTSMVSKTHQRPARKRWEVMLQHIEQDESIEDIVVSGGDTYYLAPEEIRMIGERLLNIPHIRRFRLASKGLAVAPGRILDQTDSWASTLIDLSNKGRELGKQVCLHTHFNNPNEITWVTKEAARHLFKSGVMVRNQTVLLKGVNDDLDTMSALIKSLADINIQPYYVYQCDLVRGIEDLRTPLRTILDLDKRIRGTLSGFMVPSFVVDLPGGGGKRLASTHDSYDEDSGVSTWSAPGLPGTKGKATYTYYDPRPWTASAEAVRKLHEQQDRMYEKRSTRLEDITHAEEVERKVPSEISAALLSSRPHDTGVGSAQATAKSATASL